MMVNRNLQAILAITCIIGFGAAKAMCSEGISYSMTLDKNWYQPSEPILVRITVSNEQLSTATVDFGWNGYGALAMDIENADGGVVCSGEQIEPRGGLVRPGTAKVLPKDSRTFTFVLNRWCATDLKPGRYSLTVSILATDKRSITLDGQFTIEKPSKEKLDLILDQLASIALKDQSGRYGRDEAMEMLAFADSVQYKGEILKRFGIYSHIGIDAVKKLESLGSSEAVEVLMSLGRDEAINPVVRATALQSLGNVRGRAGAALKAAIDDYSTSDGLRIESYRDIQVAD